MRILVLLSLFLLASSCSEKDDGKLFRNISSSESGLKFTNKLSYDPDFNIFKYRNFYNGGGVGIIDYDQDGLIDIYFSSNQESNRLFKNLGNLKFEDVTNEAGIAGNQKWSTGVSIVDINSDGWPDIYQSNSGDVAGDSRENELFINNGDGSFMESASEYGLADAGFSIHASFFDYDQDGDLDVYVLNNSYKAIGSFDLEKNQRHVRNVDGGDRLYRNDGNTFTDISVEAGIYGSEISFGLAATVCDVNNDGWLDIYVSNDFFERDYLYINNKQGGFDENLKKMIQSMSAAAMGTDIADINNDGWQEIFVTDMLPPTNARVKTVTTFDSWDRYYESVKNDYGHQFTRNTLQLNNGDGTFSEIGRLAGVEATDWSWSALIFDFQNDGWKDIYVSNGIYQDLTNQDFLRKVTDEKVMRQITAGRSVDYESLISYIPSVPIPSHGFINNGDLTFEDLTAEIGLDASAFSNGAAYGDFDNDGDLDLVVNNSNGEAFFFENRTDMFYPENHSMQIDFSGVENSKSIGARVEVHSGSKTITTHNIQARGFQSSMDPRLIIGLGNVPKVDSLKIIWNDGTESKYVDVPTNEPLRVNNKQSTSVKNNQEKLMSLYRKDTTVLTYKHTENDHSDFSYNKLVPNMLSTQGPCTCTGDLNNDGLDDLYLGGAADVEGKIYKQNADLTFEEKHTETLSRTKGSEDVDCVIFDANGDGNLDLYIATGGSDFNPNAAELNDRLFLGDGKFGLELVRQTLPGNKFESTSTVGAVDYDKDGDIDLFVGSRFKNFHYGQAVNGYILQNNGLGEFTNVTPEIAAGLQEIGMITDSQWADIDMDNDLDLIMVGDWMSITILKQVDGVFDSPIVIPNTSGWWNTLEIADVNGDSLPDIVAGNHGLNSRFHATTHAPVEMYVRDFDRNGTSEQIIGMYQNDSLFPISLKHDLEAHIPFIAKKYSTYEDYKNQRIEDLFPPGQLSSSHKLEVTELETCMYINSGNDNFEKLELPIEVQFSPVQDILIDDLNGDGENDVLFGGNFYSSKPELGRYDASFGHLLIGTGHGDYEVMPPSVSGIYLNSEIRHLLSFNGSGSRKIVVAISNNDSAKVFVRQ